MTVSGDCNERIHALWDELADFDVARMDAGIDHLMASLCDLVDARNASWIGAVRLDHTFAGDPVHGWRARHVRFLRQSFAHNEAAREQMKDLEQGTNVDETTIRNVAGAGTFRANRFCDLVPAEWFDSDYYLRHFRAAGHADAVWIAFPVNQDAESYFGVYRGIDQEPFSVNDRDTVAYALRGIKWFHRQLMLSHGLVVAETPLTPMERLVLHGLLTGLAEKQIAAAQGQSHHTTHEYVSNIYRKFGVGNRAALMALWLGRAA